MRSNKSCQVFSLKSIHFPVKTTIYGRFLKKIQDLGVFWSKEKYGQKVLFSAFFAGLLQKQEDGAGKTCCLFFYQAVKN